MTPSDPTDGAIHEGEPPYLSGKVSGGGEFDWLPSPGITSLERIQKDEDRYRRKRALLFFWLSLFCFAATLAGAVLRFLQISNWGRGGGNFAVVGDIILLWALTMLGLVVSMILCLFAIPRFKGAIVLLVLEIAPFALLLLSNLTFKPAP